MLIYDVRIIQKAAWNPNFWFVFGHTETLACSPQLPLALHREPIFINVLVLMCMTNIFHLTPWEAM